MTTITAQLDTALAKGVARAADHLKMTHTEVATEAIRLFVRSVAAEATVRKPRRKK